MMHSAAPMMMPGGMAPMAGGMMPYPGQQYPQ